jgi:hypothetical protein
MPFAAVALLVPVFTEVHGLRLAAFCVFEACCGLFWPTMGVLRSKYVPEDVRTTVINFFRVPLNLFVVAVLVNIGQLTEAQTFGICGAMLGVAYFAALVLAKMTTEGAATSKKGMPSASEQEGGLLLGGSGDDEML